MKLSRAQGHAKGQAAKHKIHEYSSDGGYRRPSLVGLCIDKSHVRALLYIPFFPMGFWDGVFSQDHIFRL